MYWLELLDKSNFLDEYKSEKFFNDCDEIISILVKIVKVRGKVLIVDK